MSGSFTGVELGTLTIDMNSPTVTIDPSTWTIPQNLFQRPNNATQDDCVAYYITLRQHTALNSNNNTRYPITWYTKNGGTTYSTPLSRYQEFLTYTYDPTLWGSNPSGSESYVFFDSTDPNCGPALVKSYTTEGYTWWKDWCNPSSNPYDPVLPCPKNQVQYFPKTLTLDPGDFEWYLDKLEPEEGGIDIRFKSGYYLRRAQHSTGHITGSGSGPELRLKLNIINYVNPNAVGCGGVELTPSGTLGSGTSTKDFEGHVIVRVGGFANLTQMIYFITDSGDGTTNTEGNVANFITALQDYTGKVLDSNISSLLKFHISAVPGSGSDFHAWLGGDTAVTSKYNSGGLSSPIEWYSCSTTRLSPYNYSNSDIYAVTLFTSTATINGNPTSVADLAGTTVSSPNPFVQAIIDNAIDIGISKDTNTTTSYFVNFFSPKITISASGSGGGSGGGTTPTPPASTTASASTSASPSGNYHYRIVIKNVI